MYSYEKNSRKLRQYIFCQHCNRSDSTLFETHHLVFRSERPKHKNLHHIDNLIILRKECHDNFHAHKRKARAKYVIDRNLTKLFDNAIL